MISSGKGLCYCKQWSGCIDNFSQGVADGACQVSISPYMEMCMISPYMAMCMQVTRSFVKEKKTGQNYDVKVGSLNCQFWGGGVCVWGGGVWML